MKTTLQARIEKCRGSARFSQEVQELLLRECELAEEKLSAQESELTKLRKRVEVLEEALSFYGNPESWIIRDKHSWRKSSPKSHGDDETILTYQHPNRDWVGTVVVGGIRAREALKKSKELGAG